MADETVDSVKFAWSLKEIGPWVLGAAALVQVWLIGLWKKFRKGRVEIYESGLIEIGYGDLGPSLGLTGTLRGLDKDVFVKRMSAKVKRRRDNAEYLFTWYAFRPTQLSLGPQESIKLEIASSFLLTPTQPHKYNIFFADNAFVSEYRPKVQPFQKEWYDFIDSKLNKMGGSKKLSAAEVFADEHLKKNFFNEFSKTPAGVNGYSTLDRAFYWNEGEYELELVIEASNPDRSFSNRWTFNLTQENVDHLRLNSICILETLCGIQVTYSFAYPEYRPLPFS